MDHEIEQMVLVAVGAQEGLMGSDTAPGFFQMPAQDSELLSFSVFDLLKRVSVKGRAVPAGVRQSAGVDTGPNRGRTQ
jgi:hypothetical protein